MPFRVERERRAGVVQPHRVEEAPHRLRVAQPEGADDQYLGELVEQYHQHGQGQPQREAGAGGGLRLSGHVRQLNGTRPSIAGFAFTSCYPAAFQANAVR
jgi:hypothetical protein